MDATVEIIDKLGLKRFHFALSEPAMITTVASIYLVRKNVFSSLELMRYVRGIRQNNAYT